MAKLENEIICVSGKFEGHTQEEMEALVANNGATVSSSVTKKTTMLVTGDKVGATKLTKAQELGIKIVPQEEFFKMVGGDVDASSETEDSDSEVHNVHLEIFHRSYWKWAVRPITKDELENFKSKEYYEEYYEEDDDDDFDYESLLNEDVSIAEDYFEFPERCDIWGDRDEVTVNVDGEEIEDVDTLIDEAIEDGHIKTETREESIEQSDLYYYVEEFGGSLVLTCDFKIKEDFDVKKFSIVKNKVFFNGNTYVESDVYYDGECLDFDREALDPSEEEIHIIGVETANAASSNANSLEGEVVCVSGKFEGHTQEEMEALVANSGATVSSSVTKKTTMLVTGDKVGATKLTKAQELGIKIVPQEEFFKMVGGVQTSVSNKNISGETVDYSKLSKSIELAFNDDDTCSVNDYNGKKSDVVIPSKVINEGKTYSVTSIGGRAFSHCENLSSIVIPDSVTSIGESAFNKCYHLDSIVIPDSVTSIGYGAFAGCENLSSIVIPDRVTSIGESAFLSCYHLDSIVIPDSVTSIGKSAFSNCKSLSSIVIPDSVTSIGEWAFYGCKNLSSIVIPDSVTSIGEGAFSCCEKLSSIVIPDSVTSIGNDAFSCCGNLSSIVIPDSVTSIGNRAFGECKKLSSIVIPDSVTSIGDKAFYECEKLSSIVIPDSVTSIGKSAFDGCVQLSSIVIPDSVTSIERKTFLRCEQLSSIVIPEGVTSIGESTFYGCKNLSSIVIPDSVTSIGAEAFVGCKKLSSIVIPEGVTSIGKCTFKYCENLSSIVIPDSVTSIGERAFACCKNLKEITIPKHGIDLGGDVFDGCEALDEKIKDAFYEACKK